MGSPRDAALQRFRRGAAECVCAAGGAVAALLAVGSTIGRVAAKVSVHIANNPARAPRVEGTVGFVFATLCALAGAALALAPQRWLDRCGKRWLAPIALLLLVALLGYERARWLSLAAPLAVLAVSPLFHAGPSRGLPSPGRDARDALVCIASEGACLGLGAWLPLAASIPALLVPIMTAAALAAVFVAVTRLEPGARWRLVFAALPALALPLEGLRRNPTLLPLLVCVLLIAFSAWLLARRPAIERDAVAWARRYAATWAIPALILFLVLPWHFRDLPNADIGGHEGQHLGWISSMSFGKMMMADAGFTYGPLREYTLFVATWLQGGLTLEHVRVAHVAVNVLGLVCLFAAMRRVAAGQAHLLLLGVLLLLTHSVLVSFVVYTSPAYSFGWADAARAGLATLSVVLVLGRRRRNARASRRSLLSGGALAAVALLYSHDFALPAVLGSLVGLASETLLPGPAPFRVRVRAALRHAATYGVAIAAVLVPFLAVYAVRGRLALFLQGYAWTVQVSSSTAAFDSRSWWLTTKDWSTYSNLTAPYWTENEIGARVADQLLGPALAILGGVHVVAALVGKRFRQRTALVTGLTVLSALTLHHAFLNADPWHAANAATPGFVLLVALSVGARTLSLPRHLSPWLPIGAVLAALVPAFWLVQGGYVPINYRLARIASGDERPSTGPAYSYPDLPRAGDEHIGEQHLGVVRWVRAHSAPGDPVYCTTWLLGGGTEAFLSDRRNPTSFDKPDEIVNPRFQRRAFEELMSDPPRLIVGSDFEELGSAAIDYIHRGWHLSGDPAAKEVWERNR